MPAIRSIVTLSARYLLTAVMLGGLLLVPVRCPLVDHPHSIFSMPRAMGMAMPMGETMGGHATGDMTEHAHMMGASPAPGMAMSPRIAPERLPELVAAVERWSAGQAGSAVRGEASDGVIDTAGQVLQTTGTQARPAVDPVPMLLVSDTLVALGSTFVLLHVASGRVVRWPALRAPLTGRITGVLVPPPRVVS